MRAYILKNKLTPERASEMGISKRTYKILMDEGDSFHGEFRMFGKMSVFKFFDSRLPRILWVESDCVEKEI